MLLPFSLFPFSQHCKVTTLWHRLYLDRCLHFITKFTKNMGVWMSHHSECVSSSLLSQLGRWILKSTYKHLPHSAHTNQCSCELWLQNVTQPPDVSHWWIWLSSLLHCGTIPILPNTSPRLSIWISKNRENMPVYTTLQIMSHINFYLSILLKVLRTFKFSGVMHIKTANKLCQ
jgi:hypothetical protein